MSFLNHSKKIYIRFKNPLLNKVMEKYREERRKILTYRCTRCKKICKNEPELRQHVMLTKHYYKIDSKEDEGEIKKILYKS